MVCVKYMEAAEGLELAVIFRALSCAAVLALSLHNPNPCLPRPHGDTLGKLFSLLCVGILFGASQEILRHQGRELQLA